MISGLKGTTKTELIENRLNGYYRAVLSIAVDVMSCIDELTELDEEKKTLSELYEYLLVNQTQMIKPELIK